MSEKSSGGFTWIMVGAGCLVLTLIGGCLAVFALGFFSYRSAAEQVAMPEVQGPEALPVLVTGPAPLPTGYRPVLGDGYSFAVPVAWTDQPPANTLVSVGSPVEIGGFMPNVNLVNEPFFGDLDAYMATSRLQLLAIGATIVAERPSNVGPVDARDLEVSGAQSVAIQRVAVGGSRGWVMTCSGGPGTLDLIRSQCLQIFETLRLTGG